MSVQEILVDCGLTGAGYTAVFGGDINRSFRVTLSGKHYFLKVNAADKYPGMFEKEGRGLEALHELALYTNPSNPVVIPKLVRCGIVNDSQYLLLDWIDKGNRDSEFWEHFGRALAKMHKEPQPYFGWSESNYIGSLVQLNTPGEEWATFFANCRLQPLIKILYDAGSLSKSDLDSAENLYARCMDLFPPTHPSLLHGDLWSGNFMVSETGFASVFDPAVYNGHHEMDIGMTMLFGGFDSRFYAAYNEEFPLAPGWKERLSLTQLYPILVHAVLFGGHYVSWVREILKAYTA